MQLVKQFYSDQQGVYMIMTGLLSFILLGVIALSVDGSGLLLDKARLQQGTEQAALALVSESNEYRKVKEHADVTRQVVTSADMAAFGGDKFKTQQYKRNQELVQGFVKVYLRTPYNNQNNTVDSPAEVTVSKDFDYKCEEVEVTSAKSEYLLRKPVVCQVRAEVNRKSWLYLKDISLSFDKRERINSGTTYASKEKSVVIPIDLILVTDLSGSMYEDEYGNNLGSNNHPRSKIQSLRNVVNSVADILIPTNLKEGVSPYNRIGMVSFAFGAQLTGLTNGAKVSNETGWCTLPYEGKNLQLKVTVKFTRQSYEELKAANLILKDWRGYHYDYARAEREVRQQYCPSWCNASWRNAWNAKTDGWYDDYKVYSKIYIEDNAVKIIRGLLTSFTGVYAGYGHGNDRDDNDYKVQQADGQIALPLNYAFYKYFDMNKTLAGIDNFDGRHKAYDLYNRKNLACLGKPRGNPSLTSSYSWFKQTEKNNLTAFLNNLNPEGNTLSSSGMLVGANLLMEKNPLPDAQPSVVGVNTQRILLVMSDGKDTVFTNLTKELQQKGMCTRIKNRLDTLQQDGYKKLPAKIAFVMFGSQELSSEHKAAWMDCVGQKNYFEAKNEAQLLDAFKQIINIDEEVGKLSNEKPKFK